MMIQSSQYGDRKKGQSGDVFGNFSNRETDQKRPLECLTIFNCRTIPTTYVLVHSAYVLFLQIFTSGPTAVLLPA